MTAQRVFQVGNSLVVTIPKELAVKHDLRPGVKVLPKESEEGILFETARKLTPSEWLKKSLASFEKKHARALRELAKR